ncbi:MAG: hypothetical protein E6G92_06545 [Alphaproteobacteria bacterium]|nr:MAG: hypothetical protein E6G92_06545 [Alphaproteobacteria bacterium]
MRAIVIQDVEYAFLTEQSSGLWCDRHIVIDWRESPISEVDRAIMDSRRLSTATRTLAAEAEFEGIIRALPNAARNDPRVPRPAFEATIQVERVDHVRLIEVPTS